jgi:hypothetical protein
VHGLNGAGGLTIDADFHCLLRLIIKDAALAPHLNHTPNLLLDI